MSRQSIVTASVCLSVCLSVCGGVEFLVASRQSIVTAPVCLSSVCLSVCLSVVVSSFLWSRFSHVRTGYCNCLCLFVCLSVCVSVCVCVCVCMWWCRVSCGVVSRTSRQGTVTASVRLPVCVPVCLSVRPSVHGGVEFLVESFLARHDRVLTVTASVCLFVRLCMVVLSFLRNRFSHCKTGYCNCLHLCKRRCQTALHSLHSPFYSSRLLLKTKACKERSATAPSLFVRFKLTNG